MWRFVAAHAFVRFIIVIGVAIAITFLALASTELPTHVVFVILAWPSAMMAWLFPPPCFDEGPGRPPVCEGTPVQEVSGWVGVAGTFLFYCLVTSWVLNRYLKRRVPVSARPATANERRQYEQHN